ncbi:MAG: AIPR family protein [Phycisphaerae bacterium]
MSKPTVVTLKSQYSRRMPDPNFKPEVERTILFCRAVDIPPGIPLDPNPRAQNLNRRVYREVKASLLNEDDSPPDTFHLKNKGLTLICDNIEQLDDKGTFRLTFDPTQGIVDGGHTYKIILEAQQASQENACPESQFVKVEVLKGINTDWVSCIAGGLNTSMQVQAMSIAELENKFEWIHEELKGQPFAGQIAYRENERNAQDRPFDIRDIVSWLALFNIDLYPVDGDRFPIQAYASKEAVLNEYLQEANLASFRKLRPLLVEILQLHDLVQREALRGYREESGGHSGALAFVRKRKRGEFQMVFTGESCKYCLYDGALYPMLGAFRWMIQDGKKEAFKWRGSGFADVQKLLKKIVAKMMISTKALSDKSGRNPNALGKNRTHWENLFRTVAMEQMQQQMSRSR